MGLTQLKLVRECPKYKVRDVMISAESGNQVMLKRVHLDGFSSMHTSFLKNVSQSVVLRPLAPIKSGCKTLLKVSFVLSQT